MPTPIDSSLRTGWVVIATEGETVDGRQIPAQWIVDMAETYDPQTYTAMLWPDHFRWGGNLGDVIELKHEKVKGKETLFAVLSPSRDLTFHNSRGQYRFCSIEPEHDFAGTGKTYLTGLGVTDQPASLGTTSLRFSSAKGTPVIGQSMPLDLSGIPLPSGGAEQGVIVGLVDKFFNLLSGNGAAATPPAPAPKDSTEMNEEQMNKLAGMFTLLGTQIETFSAKVDAIGKPADPPADDPAPAPAADPAPAPASTISAEQFGSLEKTFKGFGEQLAALNEKIESFSVEVPGQRPNGLGGKDEQVKAL